MKENLSATSPSFAAVQLDSLEALCAKWRQSMGQRSTEPLKAYMAQYRDIMATGPQLYADLGRQQDPALNARHQELVTQANALLALASMTLARKGEAGHLQGPSYIE